jgi:hypothetical protein
LSFLISQELQSFAMILFLVGLSLGEQKRDRKEKEKGMFKATGGKDKSYQANGFLAAF